MHFQYGISCRFLFAYELNKNLFELEVFVGVVISMLLTWQARQLHSSEPGCSKATSVNP